jgi:hypothetical protein
LPLARKTRSRDGRVEGKNGFHAKGLYYIALKKKFAV